MKKRVKFLAIVALVALVGIWSCKKDETTQPVKPIKSTTTQTTNSGTLKIEYHKNDGTKGGGIIVGTGDTIVVIPGIENAFWVVNWTAGTTYTFNFCSTVKAAQGNPPQVLMEWPVVGTDCSLTVTGSDGTTVTVLIQVRASTAPATEALFLISSAQQTDGSYLYNLGVRANRCSANAGNYFQIGDQTSWAYLYNATFVAGDSLIRFSLTTYNNAFKINAGRGTTYCIANPSAYLSSLVDNTFNVIFYNGAIHVITTVVDNSDPGTLGDPGGPSRIAVTGANVVLYFNVKNYIGGSKSNPYWEYQPDGANWTSGHLALTAVNGNGWFTATIPLATVQAMPNGQLNYRFGAASGLANMSTSTFYNNLISALSVAP